MIKKVYVILIVLNHVALNKKKRVGGGQPIMANQPTLIPPPNLPPERQAGKPFSEGRLTSHYSTKILFGIIFHGLGFRVFAAIRPTKKSKKSTNSSLTTLSSLVINN